MKYISVSMRSVLGHVVLLFLIVLAPFNVQAPAQPAPVGGLANQPKSYDESDLIEDENEYPVPYAFYDFSNDGRLDLLRHERDGRYFAYFDIGNSDRADFRSGIEIARKDIEALKIEFVDTRPVDKADDASPDTVWQFISYPRFDIYVEQTYFDDNSTALMSLFDHFAERFDLLELQTGWSSEEYVGQKLRINVSSNSGGCWGGTATPGNATVWLSNPPFSPDCRLATYNDGVPSFGNPGEMGDGWSYVQPLLHESLHAINPRAILGRRWMTEGWSRYYEKNLLADYGDINQETADHYIQTGIQSYSWFPYVANDYHDTSPQNQEIQSSFGYDIVSWMLSMMRDLHALSWQSFYDIVDKNPETLARARILGIHYVDSDIIDILGRASALDYSATQAIWRYDGPSGPGWGVRNWTSLSWYADLSASLTVSEEHVMPGDTALVTCNVSNPGGVSLDGVTVRLYDGEDLIGDQVVAVASGASVSINWNFAGSDGSHILHAVVNPNSEKLESNYSNNSDSAAVSFSGICGDANSSGLVNVSDVVFIINYIFSGGPAPNPIESGDANCNGLVNISDGVYLINYIFTGGPAPCAACQ